MNPTLTQASIKQAVILAAGMGSRLGALTEEKPKCMVQVGGMTIIQRALGVLKSIGIQEAVIVTGYKKDVLEGYVRQLDCGLKLTFVDNPDYATTNNIYSLWLAQPAIHSDFLLIESDVLFSVEMIQGLLSPCSTALSLFQSWMNGTVVTLTPDRRVSAIYLKNDPKPSEPLYKTVNLYSFDLATWNGKMWPVLDGMVRAGTTDVYYEAAFAKVVNAGGLVLRGFVCPSKKWHEVDTPDDLKAAMGHVEFLSSK